MTDTSLHASGAAFVFERTGTQWDFETYLKAEVPGFLDSFGMSVACSLDRIVVGALGEDSNATGIGGDATDDSMPYSGAAYVFERNGSTWTQAAYLKASNTNTGDRFGRSVGIDGDSVVVGAPEENSSATGIDGPGNDNQAGNSGAAYVFRFTGSTWSQEAYVKASNTDFHDRFGNAVSLSGDTLVIGADQEDSSARGLDGDESDDNTYDSGAAFVFDRVGTAWQQTGYLKPSNGRNSFRFGVSLDLDGEWLAVGAIGEDSPSFGLNGAQDPGTVGSSGSGAVYVWERTAQGWCQRAFFKSLSPAARDEFGSGVGIGGGFVVGGAPGVDRLHQNIGRVTSLDLSLIPSMPIPYQEFCYGDGLGISCNCGNDDLLNPSTGGCVNSSGRGAILTTNGESRLCEGGLTFSLTHGPPGSLGVLLSGRNLLGGGLGVPGTVPSDGLRCVGGNLLRHGARAVSALGEAASPWGTPNGIPGRSQFVIGQTRHFQVRYRDLTSASCGSGTNTTQSISLTFVP